MKILQNIKERRKILSEKTTRGDKRLLKYCNADLYNGIKKFMSSEDYTYSVDMNAYVEFYELMIQMNIVKVETKA